MKNWFIAISIALLSMLFFDHAINLFYSGEKLLAEEPKLEYNARLSEKQQKVLKEEYDKKMEVFDKKMKGYMHNRYVIALIVGCLAILTGGFLKIEGVSSGMIGGGVLTILWNSALTWFFLQELPRFILLGIALIIIIWIGVKYKQK